MSRAVLPFGRKFGRRTQKRPSKKCSCGTNSRQNLPDFPQRARGRIFSLLSPLSFLSRIYPASRAGFSCKELAVILPHMQHCTIQQADMVAATLAELPSPPPPPRTGCAHLKRHSRLIPRCCDGMHLPVLLQCHIL